MPRHRLEVLVLARGRPRQRLDAAEQRPKVLVAARHDGALYVHLPVLILLPVADGERYLTGRGGGGRRGQGVRQRGVPRLLSHHQFLPKRRRLRPRFVELNLPRREFGIAPRGGVGGTLRRLLPGRGDGTRERGALLPRRVELGDHAREPRLSPVRVVRSLRKRLGVALRLRGSSLRGGQRSLRALSPGGRVGRGVVGRDAQRCGVGLGRLEGSLRLLKFRPEGFGDFLEPRRFARDPLRLHPRTLDQVHQ